MLRLHFIMPRVFRRRDAQKKKKKAVKRAAHFRAFRKCTRSWRLPEPRNENAITMETLPPQAGWHPWISGMQKLKRRGILLPASRNIMHAGKININVTFVCDATAAVFGLKDFFISFLRLLFSYNKFAWFELLSGRGY